MASSTIPMTSRCEKFSLTSVLANCTAYGIYDHASRTVRIYAKGYGTVSISADTNIGVVPSKYRPSTDQVGDCIGGADSTGVLTCGNFNVYSNGNVKQRIGVNGKFLGIIEYSL